MCCCGYGIAVNTVATQRNSRQQDCRWWSVEFFHEHGTGADLRGLRGPDPCCPGSRGRAAVGAVAGAGRRAGCRAWRSSVSSPPSPRAPRPRSPSTRWSAANRPRRARPSTDASGSPQHHRRYAVAGAGRLATVAARVPRPPPRDPARRGRLRPGQHRHRVGHPQGDAAAHTAPQPRRHRHRLARLHDARGTPRRPHRPTPARGTPGPPRPRRRVRRHRRPRQERRIAVAGQRNRARALGVRPAHHPRRTCRSRSRDRALVRTQPHPRRRARSRRTRPAPPRPTPRPRPARAHRPRPESRGQRPGPRTKAQIFVQRQPRRPPGPRRRRLAARWSDHRRARHPRDRAPVGLRRHDHPHRPQQLRRSRRPRPRRALLHPRPDQTALAPRPTLHLPRLRRPCRPGPTPTTSSTGPTAAPPTWTTPPCSAKDTTPPSTPSATTAGSNPTTHGRSHVVWDRTQGAYDHALPDSTPDSDARERRPNPGTSARTM